jgi:hypothetical protein
MKSWIWISQDQVKHNQAADSKHLDWEEQGMTRYNKSFQDNKSSSKWSNLITSNNW